MVPGVSLQRAGIDLVGRSAGEPVHPFLDSNGDHSRYQRQYPWNFQRMTLGVHDLFNPGPTDPHASGKQDDRQQNGRHALQPVVPVLMLVVGLLA